jgi:hypothetical protein
MSSERNGPCVGGPHDGEVRSYGSSDMPILTQGADTEGDLLGHYRFKAGQWHWQPEAQPDDADRTR